MRAPPRQLSGAVASRRMHTLLPLARGQPSRHPTVYIQGFLTSAHDDAWGEWLGCHTRLQQHWGEGAGAYGYAWETGGEGDRFGRYPIPVATTASSALMIAKALLLPAKAMAPTTTLLAALVGDTLANAARLHAHFREANKQATLHAERLAEALDRLGDGPIRLVAHSLGCLLALEALAMLPKERRPIETHLCAPAVTEKCAAHLLPTASHPDGRTIIYYSRRDEVLTTAFQMYTRGERAIGCAPLASPLPANVSLRDVTNYYSLVCHNEYPKTFDVIAADALAGAPLPPPRAAAAGLTAASARLASEVDKEIKRVAEVARKASQPLRAPPPLPGLALQLMMPRAAAASRLAFRGHDDATRAAVPPTWRRWRQARAG